MKVIPNSKFFQLEAISSDKKLTGQCMIPDKYTPKSSSVNVMVQSCNPTNRGRWEFGHWKGNFQWTEWTEQNFERQAQELMIYQKFIGFLKIV